jgi:tetratricopeptide (TPR) repeat protein
MKRYLLMAIFTVPIVAALSALVLRQSESMTSGPSMDSAARRMWASVGDSSATNEHELKVLETTLKQNPDHAPILVRMAQLSRDLGNHDTALRHLQEAVKADPKNRDARLELGRALFESGDVEGAIRETQQLLELDPRNVDGLYNLGAIYGNLGQDDRAREYWNKAVAADPESEGAERARSALKQIGG